jgi:hypothetical protein
VGRRSSEAAISLKAPAEEILVRRLKLLGWRYPGRVRTHANRRVMVSLTSRGELRLHKGYAYAPDRILRAILRFLSPRLPRPLRRLAEREFLAFPVEQYAPPPPGGRRGRERPRPGDVMLLYRLSRLHQELNDRHFDGRLTMVPIRLSSRMRTRLGELSMDLRTGSVIEIAISRMHIEQHPWDEVAHTMLHEMVHQWQAETGRPVDHGATFRAKAREVGALPKARRRVRTAARRMAG